MNIRIALLAGGIALAASTALAQQQPLRIGGLLPYSGPLAALGQDVHDGLEMAFQTVGNRIEGRPVEILKRDYEGKPQVALAKARELVAADRADLLVGPVSSGAGLAIRDFIDQAKVPLLPAYSGADELTGERCSPYILRFSFSNNQLAVAPVKWMIDNGIKTVATIAQDYAAGRQIANGFAEAFKAAGGQVLGMEFTPFGQTRDFGPYLARLKDLKPQALWVFSSGSEAITFIRQANDFKMSQSMRLVGLASTVEEPILVAAGEAALGFVAIGYYVKELDNPVNRTLQELSQAKLKRSASTSNQLGFEIGLSIIEALKITKGRTDDKAALAQAFRQVKFNGVRGAIQLDPATNNIINTTIVSEIVKMPDGSIGNKVLAIQPNLKDPPNGCKLGG
jgi:branched-chain amino acid transport system substrate-binding protein